MLCTKPLTSSVLYTKPLGKNAFHLFWTEITEVIFSMSNNSESPRAYDKKRADEPKVDPINVEPREDRLQFLSADDVICRIRRILRETTSSQQTLLQSRCFSRVTSSTEVTFSE